MRDNNNQLVSPDGYIAVCVSQPLLGGQVQHISVTREKTIDLVACVEPREMTVVIGDVAIKGC